MDIRNYINIQSDSRISTIRRVVHRTYVPKTNAKITSSINITKYPALNIANSWNSQTHSPMKWRSVRLCYI